MPLSGHTVVRLRLFVTQPKDINSAPPNNTAAAATNNGENNK
jgi:hypothetical protein